MSEEESRASVSGSRLSRRFVLGALAAPAGPARAFRHDRPGGGPVRGAAASWNDGPAKQAILDFIRATTDASSKDFVPPEERIATFDQDGTLWVEHPIYTQLVYCLDRVPAVVKEKPALAHVEPFKTVLTGDFEKIGKLSLHDFETIAVATLTGMSADEFAAEVKAWIDDRQGSSLEAALHRADLPADAGGAELLPRQRLQDLYRHRRRAGFRARLFRARLRHPAGAGGRHARSGRSTATTRTASRS